MYLVPYHIKLIILSLGDTGLPYKHDARGDKALPYKHDSSGLEGKVVFIKNLIDYNF